MWVYKYVCVYVYIYIYIYIFMNECKRVVQKVQQILDLASTFHFYMAMTCTEINLEIWFFFSSSIRSDSVLPQQK